MPKGVYVRTKAPWTKGKRWLGTGSSHPNWKGDSASIKQFHTHVKRIKIRPAHCEHCGKESLKLDLANITGTYDRNPDSYKYICRACHVNSDKRGVILRTLWKGKARPKSTRDKISAARKLYWKNKHEKQHEV